MTLPVVLVDTGGWLYDWQTLVSGLLALGAAWWATAYVRRQIAQTDFLHRQEIERRHNATRTILPLALAGIIAFLKAMADKVADEIELRNPTNPETEGMPILLEPRRLESIDLPIDNLTSIRDFAETLLDKDNLRHVAEMIGQLQISHSRYDTFDFSIVNIDDQLHELLLKIGIAKALAERVFNYSRFVDDKKFGIVGNVSNQECWDIIMRSFQGLIFRRNRLDLYITRANEKIAQFKARNTSPWLEVF